jgi:hypothetical protein
MSAAIELLPQQPTAHAPFAATNLILDRAEQAGKLTRVDALADGFSVEEAIVAGHAVTVARMALAIDELVMTREALLKALRDDACRLLRAAGYTLEGTASVRILAAIARAEGRAS